MGKEVRGGGWGRSDLYDFAIELMASFACSDMA